MSRSVEKIEKTKRHLLPFITTPPIYNNLSNLRNPPITSREYEEQIHALKRENFNLKLRIFFLEENNSFVLNHPDDDDRFFHDNIKLKVECETLRHELHEKQNLLCEAAIAMDLMEENYRRSEVELMNKIDKLQDKILFLEVCC